jgi:hypothetical protein
MKNSMIERKSLFVVALVLGFSLAAFADNNKTNTTTLPPGASFSEPVESSSSSEISSKSTPSQKPENVSGEVEITFMFTNTNSYASNQYAVWIEDNSGVVVKTLFVSRFAGSGSPQNPLPYLGEKLKQSAVDAVTGATPQFGEQRYIWDLTNDNGATVSAGTYNVIIEAGMYVDNSVVYTAPIIIGGEETEVEAIPEYTSDNEQYRFMLSDVKAKYLL